MSFYWDNINLSLLHHFTCRITFESQNQLYSRYPDPHFENEEIKYGKHKHIACDLTAALWQREAMHHLLLESEEVLTVKTWHTVGLLPQPLGELGLYACSTIFLSNLTES